MVLESLLGEKLIKNDGTEVRLSTEPGAIVGLYFSAHWCPPCRHFTPKLSGIYNEIKSAGHDFEIVFISWDGDDTSFKNYHGEMPWLAIPFDASEKKEACSDKYNVQGIPTLVLLDASTGDTIKADGREAIDSYGAAGFPFTEARFEECRKEKEEKKAKVLKEMASLSFLPPLTTIEQPEIELSLHSVTGSCEALALAFMRGRTCQGSCLVLPKLIDIQEILGKDKLSIIVIATEELEQFDESLKTKMKNIPMVKYGEKSKEIAKKCEEAILSDIDPPHVFVTATNDATCLKVLAENAARDIYYVGAPGFPWSTEALDAMKAKEAALKEEVKSKQKNLEFFASGDQSHVVDKSGAVVPLSTLQSKDVVALYFSAHWCGPCRAFTPSLTQLYNKCKEQGKSFEIVFLSSDRDEAAFDEYYAEMPWCTVPYQQRSLKNAFSGAFDVTGIPTLVLLRGDGELITNDGRTAVESGVDSFPWTPTGQ